MTPRARQLMREAAELQRQLAELQRQLADELDAEAGEPAAAPKPPLSRARRRRSMADLSPDEIARGMAALDRAGIHRRG